MLVALSFCAHTFRIRDPGDPSQRTLRISAAGSRFAHARKTPQPTISRRPSIFGPVEPVEIEILRKERSGFRLRAPASLTPAKRLNLPLVDGPVGQLLIVRLLIFDRSSNRSCP